LTSEKAKAKKTDESKNALSKETKTEWSFKWFMYDYDFTINKLIK
jgi:hypothetical protein